MNRPRPPPSEPPFRGSAAGSAKGASKGAAKGATKGTAIGKGRVKSEAAIVVFDFNGNGRAELDTLVGEYVEEAVNHGRKSFRKLDQADSVWIYFWDDRDGAEYSGWWFGEEVGGSQVWSRNASNAKMPPKSGWMIPWDGRIEKDLVVMSVEEKAAHDQKEARLRQLTRAKEEEEKATVDWEDRVEKAALRLAEVQMDADEALRTARFALEGDDIDEDAIKVAAEQVGKSAIALAECQRFLASETLASQKAPQNLKAELAQLNQKVKKLQADVKEEQHRVKNYKIIKLKEAEAEAKRIETEAKNQELADQHRKQLEQMLPAVQEKVDNADQEVEQVAIVAAPLQMDDYEDMRESMLEVIKEIELKVRTAQAAIGDAKRFLSGKQAQAQKFTGDAKEAAMLEFEEMKSKLEAAQEKVNPFKTIRQDFEQRVQGKKIIDDLNERISGAEIEVEKAAMMTAPLGGDSMEGIKETESSLSTAQSALSTSQRLVDSKLKTLDKKNPVFEEVKSLQARAKSAQQKLDEIRKTVKETQVRVAADTLLKDASEKVGSAEDELQKMSEAELPFLRGNPKGSEMQELIATSEEVSSKVQSALSEAQTFVAKKLVEVARFSEGHAKAVREDLDALQKRLADGRMRLQKFRAGTQDHKRTYMLEEVDVKITAAEAELQQMTEATAALGNVGAAGDGISDSLKETLSKATAAERAAQASVVIARKCLMQKTQELKSMAAGAGSGAQLGKFQTRVNNIQQEISKLKNATQDAEERMRAKQTLIEVATRLQATEVEVEKVAADAAPTDDALLSSEAVDRLSKTSESVGKKLGATMKLVEIKLKSAQGFLKEELQGMKLRLTTAEKKLEVVVLAFQEQKERVLASEILADAGSKVETAEAAMEKASQSELPFLKGVEVEATEAFAAVSICEAGISTAQSCITDARSFVVDKIAEVKKFRPKPSESCTSSLVALQKRLDATATRLAELKKDTTERKRKSQLQASAAKIGTVEAAVQALATTIGKFSDDRLAEISADDARGLLEEIAESEESAQRAVSEARTFLAQRLQEIKGFSEAQRAPMTADVTKLQSRLTQCQVELAKLSKQCTEREQRYVAQKLIEDANQNLEKIMQEIELASRISPPVLNAGTEELLKVSYTQSVVGMIQTYMRTSDITVAGLFAMMTKADAASAAAFSMFLDKLSELTGKEDASLTNDQAADVFAQLSGNKSSLTAADFQAACRDCYLCTVPVELMSDITEAGQEVGVLEVGEAVVVLDKKGTAEAVTHAHCLLARDGTKAWARLKGEDGTSNFKPSQVGAPALESVLAFASSLYSRCSEAAEAIEQKATEVGHVKQGPLVAVKPKLLELQLKVRQEQAKTEQLKNQLVAAKAEVTKRRKDDMQKVQSLKCKEFAARTTKEATDAVEAAESKAGKVAEQVKTGGEGLQELEMFNASAEEARKSLEDAKAVVARIHTSYEGFKSTSKPLLLEARVEITKLKQRAETALRKHKAATESTRAAFKAAIEKARASLRLAARSSGKSCQDLFSQSAGGKNTMSQKQFEKLVSGLANHALSNEDIKALYNYFGPEGLGETGFASIFQEFHACTKTIAITDGFDIETSTTVRKLDNGELFEVLEGPRVDSETGIPRVRGRALRDGVAGWVSVQGNQGTPFLKQAEKPYLLVAKNAPLRASSDDSSAEVRALVLGEELEVVEGPRQNAEAPEVQLHCIASKDGTQGWITAQSSKAVNASPSKAMYICKSVIAMTDVFDLTKCKILKKVAVGETLQVVGAPDGQHDQKRDINRLRFRSMKDGQEGWVSLKGNQGTVYLEVSTSHYVVESAVTLRTESQEGSEALRQLEVGEAVEVVEPPVENQPATKMIIYVRAVSDGKCGWIVFSSGTPPPVKPKR